MSGACRVPRRVVVDAVEGVVENGVACELLTSNAVSVEGAVNPADECFVLSTQQAAAIVGLLGRRKCGDLGPLPPVLSVR